jgi:hypothetical protein
MGSQAKPRNQLTAYLRKQPSSSKRNHMDKTVKILEDSTTITGFYDKEADVLYLSLFINAIHSV